MSIDIIILYILTGIWYNIHIYLPKWENILHFIFFSGLMFDVFIFCQHTFDIKYLPTTNTLTAKWEKDPKCKCVFNLLRLYKHFL